MATKNTLCRLILLLLIAGQCGPLYAKELPSAKEMITENVRRASGGYHTYEAMDTTDTPAPKGYKPFYISHITRHGSRYRGSIDDIVEYIGKIEFYGKRWGLTKDGEYLLDFMKGLRDVSTGNDGKLTLVGVREQKEIASRMTRRFPEIFSDEERNEINVFSTNVQRVIDSRDAFLSRIPEGMDVKIFKGNTVKNGRKAARHAYGKLTSAEKTAYEELKTKVSKNKILDNPDEISFKRLTFKTFARPTEYSEQDMRKFFHKIISLSLSRQCLECDLPYLDDYFTAEEVYSYWWNSNARNFRNFAICAECGEARNVKMGKQLIAVLVTDIDSALVKGCHTAADLRFSHDTQVQPLISRLGLSGNDWYGPWTEASTHWINFLSHTMAMNCQFIFYRNKSGKVLVKMLLNEREVIIPAFPPSRRHSPYYEWPKLRRYLIDLCGEEYTKISLHEDRKTDSKNVRKEKVSQESATF